MEGETIGKGVLLTTGLGLITAGANLVTTNIPAGVATMVAGFGCLTIFIYLFEKQLTKKILVALKKK